MRRYISFLILLAFLANTIGPFPLAQADEVSLLLGGQRGIHLSSPRQMVHLSPEFSPAFLKGIVVHPEDPFKFDFIIYKGDKSLSEAQKREEYTKLTKYFLASLAIPDDDQWVNLSPYEKDRIIKDDFGKTTMGRDLLAQDYMLKQITASLIYPEDNLGKKFWDKVYAQAQQQYGTTNIPVNTFNKVWIVPDSALIYEKGNMAYVVNHHLKVMLEEDYLSLQKHSGISTEIFVRQPGDMHLPEAGACHQVQCKNISSLASQIIRQIVLPELQREVNEDKNFAPLRQVYSGMILAAWFKRALKESLLGKIYANKARIKGVDQDPRINEEIYHQYLKAYKKGVFNFIKEDTGRLTHEKLPRKYFSGGTAGWGRGNFESKAMITHDYAMAKGNIDEIKPNLEVVSETLVGMKKTSPAMSSTLKEISTEEFMALGVPGKTYVIYYSNITVQDNKSNEHVIRGDIIATEHKVQNKTVYVITVRVQGGTFVHFISNNKAIELAVHYWKEISEGGMSNIFFSLFKYKNVRIRLTKPDGTDWPGPPRDALEIFRPYYVNQIKKILDKVLKRIAQPAGTVRRFGSLMRVLELMFSHAIAGDEPSGDGLMRLTLRLDNVKNASLRNQKANRIVAVLLFLGAQSITKEQEGQIIKCSFDLNSQRLKSHEREVSQLNMVLGAKLLADTYVQVVRLDSYRSEVRIDWLDATSIATFRTFMAEYLGSYIKDFVTIAPDGSNFSVMFNLPSDAVNEVLNRAMTVLKKPEAKGNASAAMTGLDLSQDFYDRDDPNFIRAVEYFNRHMVGKAVSWEEIITLYEIFRGDDLNPEYASQEREKRLQTINKSEFTPFEKLLAMINKKCANRDEALKYAATVWGVIIGNPNSKQIFTTPAINDMTWGLSGFDRILDLGVLKRVRQTRPLTIFDLHLSHPAQGHRRLAWFMMNYVLLNNGLSPVYFNQEERDNAGGLFSPVFFPHGIFKILNERAHPVEIREDNSGASLAMMARQMGNRAMTTKWIRDFFVNLYTRFFFKGFSSREQARRVAPEKPHRQKEKEELASFGFVFNGDIVDHWDETRLTTKHTGNESWITDEPRAIEYRPLMDTEEKIRSLPRVNVSELFYYREGHHKLYIGIGEVNGVRQPVVVKDLSNAKPDFFALAGEKIDNTVPEIVGAQIADRLGAAKFYGLVSHDDIEGYAMSFVPGDDIELSQASGLHDPQLEMFRKRFDDAGVNVFNNVLKTPKGKLFPVDYKLNWISGADAFNSFKEECEGSAAMIGTVDFPATVEAETSLSAKRLGAGPVRDHQGRAVITALDDLLGQERRGASIQTLFPSIRSLVNRHIQDVEVLERLVSLLDRGASDILRSEYSLDVDQRKFMLEVSDLLVSINDQLAKAPLSSNRESTVVIAKLLSEDIDQRLSYDFVTMTKVALQDHLRYRGLGFEVIDSKRVKFDGIGEGQMRVLGRSGQVLQFEFVLPDGHRLTLKPNGVFDQRGHIVPPSREMVEVAQMLGRGINEGILNKLPWQENQDADHKKWLHAIFGLSSVRDFLRDYWKNKPVSQYYSMYAPMRAGAGLDPQRILFQESISLQIKKALQDKISNAYEGIVSIDMNTIRDRNEHQLLGFIRSRIMDEGPPSIYFQIDSRIKSRKVEVDYKQEGRAFYFTFQSLEAAKEVTEEFLIGAILFAALTPYSRMPWNIWSANPHMPFEGTSFSDGVWQCQYRRDSLNSLQQRIYHDYINGLVISIHDIKPFSPDGFNVVRKRKHYSPDDIRVIRKIESGRFGQRLNKAKMNADEKFQSLYSQVKDLTPVTSAGKSEYQALQELFLRYQQKQNEIAAAIRRGSDADQLDLIEFVKNEIVSGLQAVERNWNERMLIDRRRRENSDIVRMITEVARLYKDVSEFRARLESHGLGVDIGDLLESAVNWQNGANRLFLMIDNQAAYQESRKLMGQATLLAMNLESAKYQLYAHLSELLSGKEKVKDYYEVLGVERTASQDEIKKAYRALARRWHPDINPGDEAEKRFREINEAFQILGDPIKRAEFDRAMIEPNKNKDSAMKGGIDLNSANLAMMIKRDGKGVVLPLAQQDLARLSRAVGEGLEPHILSIVPAANSLVFAQLIAH